MCSAFQFSVAIFLSLLFLEAYTITLPFMEMDENMLAIGAQLVIFTICFCGLVGKLDVNRFQGTDGKFVGFFLTTITSLVLGLAVAIPLYQAVGRKRKRGGTSNRLQWMKRLVQANPMSRSSEEKNNSSSSSAVLASADAFVDVEGDEEEKAKEEVTETSRPSSQSAGSERLELETAQEDSADNSGTVNPLRGAVTVEVEIEMAELSADKGPESGSIDSHSHSHLGDDEETEIKITTGKDQDATQRI